MMAGNEDTDTARRRAAADERPSRQVPPEESKRTLGATEDEVDRSEAVIAPEVTDMGLDERGRDQPDGVDFGRGVMPDNPAVEDIADTGGEPDLPRYGRSPRQGLGGARPLDTDTAGGFADEQLQRCERDERRESDADRPVSRG
jgi:hypothetical protein